MDDLVRRRLTKLRTDRKFTQQQVGDAVGWTQASVSKFELGDFAADLDTLVKLADFYEVTLAQLLSADGPAKPVNPKSQQLRDAIGRLSETQRDALLVMLGAAEGPKPRPSGAARRSVKQGRTSKPPRRGAAPDA